MSVFQSGDEQALIAMLRRKLARAQKAREVAEQQLERYSWEIYNANESLRQSLRESERRQAELAYLSEEAATIASSINIYQLLRDTVSLSGEFVEADGGMFLIQSEHGIETKEYGQIWKRRVGWLRDDALFELVISNLPEVGEEEISHWLVLAVENTQAYASQINWLLSLHLKLSAARTAVIVFLSSSELIDEECLFVLDTAREHLVNSIKRRLTDISVNQSNRELKKTVQHLEEARKQLLQTEKMASLGQLAAGVAHEINNPVGYMGANTEILADYVNNFIEVHHHLLSQLQQQGHISAGNYQTLIEQYDLAYEYDDAKELIQNNLEGVQRVKDIINSLKTFSHQGSAEMEPVNLEEVIESALKIVWNQLKYQYTIHKYIAPSLPLVSGNKGKLQQVFVNLFVNAAHAMEDGGELSIYADPVQRGILVRVADTGCGMTEEVKSNLFTPFFTTKGVGEGTGLGLSVSYAILEEHQATIEVASMPGRGSEFTLRFPSRDP